MKYSGRIAILAAAASVGLAQTQGQVAGQQLSAEGKSKEVAEARAKRNALNFQNNATVITFYDRTGKRTGTVGARALYNSTVLSPDGKRVAVVKRDLENETSDVWVMDVAGGEPTRLTTSARTEFVTSVVWSPDSTRIAYVTIRAGQEGIYARAANGQGPEELLYKNTGAFLILSDWSKDGRFLTFAKTDLKGGALYILPLEGGPDRQAREIFRSDMQMALSRFSPDGRYLSYAMLDKANRIELFVRPVDPAGGGPWQISEGATSPAFWRRDGKELYYVARDQAVMAAEVNTSGAFTFVKPKVLFRQQSPVPERFTDISADGERFVTLPPPRGPQLQQITIFDREGTVVKKVGEPGMYSQPGFSWDATRLVVTKNDLNTGQSDLWTIDIATGKSVQLTNDSQFKSAAMWSPDGKYILYSSMRSGDWGIYRRASDGTGSEELLFQYTPGAFLGLTDISPDGKYLICDGGIILTVPMAGGDPKSRKAIETLREEFFDDIGRVSSDGKFIAYRSDEAKPERFEVYVRPYNPATGMPGDAKWQISKDGVQAMLHWRADGKEIFFRGLDLESNDLRVMSAEVETSPTFRASPPKLLFKLPGPLGGNLGNISRDGQRFVFAVNVPAGSSPSAAAR